MSIVWRLLGWGSYKAMLTSVLLTKLPPEIRLIITRKASGEDLDLETLQVVWKRSSLPENTPVIQPRTTILLKISLGQPLQLPHLSQGYKSPAETPLLVDTVNSHTTQSIATLWLILILANKSWRPLEDASNVLWEDMLGEEPIPSMPKLQEKTPSNHLWPDCCSQSEQFQGCQVHHLSMSEITYDLC